MERNNEEAKTNKIAPVALVSREPSVRARSEGAVVAMSETSLKNESQPVVRQSSVSNGFEKGKQVIKQHTASSSSAYNRPVLRPSSATTELRFRSVVAIYVVRFGERSVMSAWY